MLGRTDATNRPSRSETDGPSGSAARHPLDPGGRRAAVHRLQSRPGDRAVQGGHRRRLSGAERAAEGNARDLAAAHHHGAGASTSGKHPERQVAPFAVNQIVHSSNDRLQHDVDLCEKYKVPIQITSLRAPDDVVKSAKRYGCLVFHDVTNVTPRQARAAGGRRRPDPGLRRRRRPCRPALALRAGAGSAPVLRRLHPALGLDRQRRVGAGRAGRGRRPRLYRHALHRQQGSQRDRRQQAVHHRQSSGEEIVYTNLFTGVHGNYLEAQRRRRRPRSRRTCRKPTRAR